MAKTIKIYTKSGDGGTTSVLGGKRVEKNSARIKAYGEVDELNSLIGVIVSDYFKVKPSIKVSPLIKKLLRVQEELFVLGSDLATPLDVKIKIPRISKMFVSRLEREIDDFSKDLRPLKKFILPGGGGAGAKLHLARAITRRAERSIVDLANQERINKHSHIYINRLSDWFFTLARYINKLEGDAEIVWKGRD